MSGDAYSDAVDAAMKQAGRVGMLAYRLVEEGVFESTDEAIAWADAQADEDKGL